MAADTNDSTTDEKKSPEEQTDADIIKEAKERRQLCVSNDSDNRVQALDDLAFLVGGENQWNPRAVVDRKAQGRPIITVNVLPSYLHQVTNDQRQNTPSIKVHPVDDQADIETGKVMQGLVRHIEYSSNADVAYDRAVNSAAGIGWGYFRLITEYATESGFDQDIKFQSFRNHLAVRIDPFSLEPDGSDMQFGFVESALSRDEFKRDFPDANANDATLASIEDNNMWLTDQTVLVNEYYRIFKKKTKVVMLSDGSSGFEDDLDKEMMKQSGLTITKERDGYRSKLEWFKLTAADVLERAELKFCDPDGHARIPIFPVYGDEVDIEGKVFRSGLIRNAKGPMQSYNTSITAATEELASRSKNPWVGAEGQFEGHEDEWARSNIAQLPYLEYKPTTVGDKLAPPPQRQPMADIPSGFLAMCQTSEHNIQRTTNLFNASIGQRGSATSGRQEIAQQREGDMANFHYQDGLMRTIRHAGRVLVGSMRYYYDGTRAIRILGEGDKAESVTINQPNVNGQAGKDGKVQEVLNNITAGKYDITVSAGPSYSTMRQENANFFATALQATKDPAQAAIFGYLALRNTDAPGADVATKMVETTLPPPAKAVLDEENGRQQDGPQVMTPKGPVSVQEASQLIAQLEQAMQQAHDALQKADAAKQAAEQAKAQHALNEQQLEPQRQAVEMKRIEAEIAKANAVQAQAQAQAAQAQADLVRANAEAAVGPATAEANLHKARATAMTAENELRQPVVMPKSPEEEAAAEAMKDSKMLAALADQLAKTRPSGADLVIKAPSGLDYNVKATLH